MEEKITYTEACNMTQDEILEANGALDVYIELLKKQQKGGKR